MFKIMISVGLIWIILRILLNRLDEFRNCENDLQSFGNFVGGIAEIVLLIYTIIYIIGSK